MNVFLLAGMAAPDAGCSADSCSSNTSSILMDIMATCLALTVQLHAVVSVTVCDFFSSW